jgi:hypothetical protein
MRMTRDEMLAYIGKHEDRKYPNKEAVQEATDKIIAIMKQFDFKLYESFNVRCRDFSNRENTTWFYRYTIAEYEYIEVQIGWLYNSYSGKTKAIKGCCRVDHTKVSLNPETGKPWKIGDWDYSNPYNPARLTKRGWYTGD